jgi:DNA-binding MarR family transcriptional regulator
MNMNMYEICLLHARSDRALRSKIASLLEESKITMMEWLLLGVVAEGSTKGSTMSDVAKALHVTLPQVTALVNKLLPLKLVKQKSASSDRRSRLVSLTSKGQLVFEENRKIMDAAQQDLFGGDAAQELDSYTKVLTRLSE